jgi:acetolactate decarboxylase
MRVYLFVLALFLITACTESTEKKTWDVKNAGALKNFMHKNDLSAKADLDSLVDKENLYALGALVNLKGEILIWNGEPIISTAKDSAVEIDKSFDHKAALLVYTTIANWQTIKVPDSVEQYEAFETFVAQRALSLGIDTAKPFPFLIIGKSKTVDWHVINWPEGDTKHTHYKHQTSGPHGTLNGQEVEILGFYSNHHHAVFTHHTTNMHLHVKTKDGKLAGHVDGLELDRGMTLYLPQ